MKLVCMVMIIREAIMDEAYTDDADDEDDDIGDDANNYIDEETNDDEHEPSCICS